MAGPACPRAGVGKLAGGSGMSGPTGWIPAFYVLFGVWLTPWARAYAVLLRGGCPADARTLWFRAPHRAVRRLRWRRDAGVAVCLGMLASFFVWASTAPPAVLILVFFLLALAWLDWHSGLLPDALTLPLLFTGWLLAPQGPLPAVQASVLMWLGLTAAASLYRRLRGQDGFGGGDIKCLAALAGWLGLAPTLVLFWLACVLGVMAYVLIAPLRRAQAPFGPYLALAAVLLFLRSALHS